LRRRPAASCWVPVSLSAGFPAEDAKAREGDPPGVTKIQGRCFLSTNATEDEIFGLTDIDGPKKAINYTEVVIFKEPYDVVGGEEAREIMTTFDPFLDGLGIETSFGNDIEGQECSRRRNANDLLEVAEGDGEGQIHENAVRMNQIRRI
jgi:hypothetical protein